jgi:hypothetical protein
MHGILQTLDELLEAIDPRLEGSEPIVVGARGRVIRGGGLRRPNSGPTQLRDPRDQALTVVHGQRLP